MLAVTVSTSAAQRTLSIHELQGAGNISRFLGQTVAVEGVVTALRSTGFYLKEPAPDDNAATSEGIFVVTRGHEGAEPTGGGQQVNVDALLVHVANASVRMVIDRRDRALTFVAGPGGGVELETRGRTLGGRAWQPRQNTKI